MEGYQNDWTRQASISINKLCAKDEIMNIHL